MDNKNYLNIIRSPRVTEKATLMAENAVYVFNVAPNATKPEIKKAVEALYKVKPTRIHVANVLSKAVFKGGKKGVKSGGKKAYVYLKKGDKISEK